MSSTTVVLKTLTNNNNDADDNSNTNESSTTLIAVGILIFQDVTFSLFMALISSISSLTAMDDNEPMSTWEVLSDLSSSLFKIGIMFTILFLFIRFLPIILKYFKHRISMEVYILFIISLCVIFTLASEHLFASSELGAFVAGLLVSASSSSPSQSSSPATEKQSLLKKDQKIEMIEETLTHLAPIRDIFGALFFASIGMLINPIFLMSNFLRILTLVIFIGITKSIAIFVCVYWRSKAHSKPKSSDADDNSDLESRRIGMKVAIALCQLGEFGFVFSSHAHMEGLISSSMHRTLLGATAVSLLMTPFVMRFAMRFIEYFTAKSTHRN